MNVLLDECLPKKLKHGIEADTIQTVPEAGWASKKNGELLRLAEGKFDVFVTNDQNMAHQQNLRKFALSFIILVAPTNDIVDLQPLIPALNEHLNTIKAGDVVYIRTMP
jgi:predicted nuclease of predicted toxin-antitoxin system